MTKFLTLEEAAQTLRLSKSSIRAYIRAGRLPAQKIAGGKRVLIAEADLLALLEPATGSEPDDSGEGEDQ